MRPGIDDHGLQCKQFLLVSNTPAHPHTGSSQMQKLVNTSFIASRLLSQACRLPIWADHTFGIVKAGTGPVDPLSLLQQWRRPREGREPQYCGVPVGNVQVTGM